MERVGDPLPRCWGAPGQFSFSHTVEDAHAALAWPRSPAATAYSVDKHRIVALGHPMGGFNASMLGDDQALAGYVLISAADMGREAAKSDFVASSADKISYTNATAATLVADARVHAAVWGWKRRAALMGGRPVLILISDDGLASTGEAAAAAIAVPGGPKPVLVHMTTDHSFNDHRVALAATIVQWLGMSFPAR